MNNNPYIDLQIEGIVQGILDFSEDDWVGIWVIIAEVKQSFETNDSSLVRQLTMKIVREILNRGLKAGGTPYSKRGFVEWPDQRPSIVVSRIENDWDRLGREPDIGDIVYFGK